MRFYLSGGMEYKKKRGGPWREWITSRLEEVGHEVVDPVKVETQVEPGIPIQHTLTKLKLAGDLAQVRELARRFLFRKDMYGIQCSHANVVLYDKSVQKGAGTQAEAWESFREGRPLYMVTEFSLEDIPAWLIAETTEIFADFDALLDYVENHAQVREDIEIAKKACHETLVGIY